VLGVGHMDMVGTEAEELRVLDELLGGKDHRIEKVAENMQVCR